MKRWLRIGILMSGWILAGCTTSGAGPILPTLGPIQATAGPTTTLKAVISTSTNCANAGETVVFTLDVHNTSSEVVTITNTPAFDMTLHGLTPTSPIQRWSDRPSYPGGIVPILQPDEQRRYQWQWIADDVYDTRGWARGPGVQIRVPLQVQTTTGISMVIEPKLYLGINAHNYNAMESAQASIECTDM